MHTNVHMGFRPLKNRSKSTYTAWVSGEDLLDRVYSSLMTESKFTGSEKRREGSRKDRHVERMGYNKRKKEATEKTVRSPNM
jgi:hypothetical protein